ncbi:MAG TPA: PadR family transcriptional regulator [Acidimicrobiia bacterium]|nr:PadR family transcriptional regulator [Acidimicrobiia bacterium]
MDQTQLLKGVLDTAVLAVLRHGRTYGYDLVRQLRESGFEGVGDASVYGTLRRLFGGGYLTSEIVPSEEGPARKYYGLNGAGFDMLEQSTKTWIGFADTMSILLQGEEEE